MTKITNFRISCELNQKFDAVCEVLKIKKSDFLRGCIQQLIKDPEGFMGKLGYKKEMRELWVKQP